MIYHRNQIVSFAKWDTAFNLVSFYENYMASFNLIPRYHRLLVQHEKILAILAEILGSNDR